MTLTFVYRTECSLCDAAWVELVEFLRSAPFGDGVPVEVERIDLADERRLELAYGHRIPVVECDGEEICRSCFDAAALMEYFRRQAIAV